MAKKKDSKVSITKLDEFLKTTKQDAVSTSVEVEGGMLEFEVKPLLSLADFHAMVNAVADAAFVVDEETGIERYDAVYEQYARNIAVLTYVANFKPETASEKLFMLSQNSYVMEEIFNVWSFDQRCQFECAVADQIEFKKQELLSAERHELQKAIEQIDKTNEVFAKFVTMIEGVDMTTLFADMQKISGMDEEQLGRAVVAARDPDFVEQRRAELQVLK